MPRITLTLDFPPGVDKGTMETLLELDNEGDSVLLYDVLLIFLSSAPSKFQIIEEAYKNKDFAKLAFEAHALKSSSANLGFETLRDASLEIEKAATASQWDHVEVGFKQLSNAYPLIYAFAEKLGSHIKAQFSSLA